MDRRVSLAAPESSPREPTCIFCSDPFVSQPSQLLQYALAPGSQSQEHRKGGDLTSPNDGNAAIDFSLDSRIIPVRPTTPRYYVQISPLRSPQDDGERVLAEDSQEENHCQENREQPRTWSSKNNVVVEPTLLGSGSEPFHQHGDSPVTASAAMVIGTRPITAGLRLHSQLTGPMPVGNKQYRRSPSLPSQDSFGGPISQDPAELYLASAKQFDVPLSDLGETSTQEVVHPPADPSVALPDASEHQEFLEDAMRKYEAQRANKATRRTNILVAATPSDSNEPSGLLQHGNDNFSFHSHSPEFAGQEPRFEFDGSSSFDKMLDRDLVDAPDPTPEPTPPNETQPAQVDDALDVRPSVRHDTLTLSPRSERFSPPFEWIAPTPSAAVASSNPRSLLRMVHPGNQYRIAKMRNLAGAVEPRSCVTKGAEARAFDAEETQPCHPNELIYSNVLPPARPAPRQTRATTSRPTTRRLREEDEYDGPEDGLDIVPDSEPLRAAPNTQTPSHHCIVQSSSPKKHFHSFSPTPKHGSGDAVPDSLDVEESEVDVPLAIEVASRNTKRHVAPMENVSAHDRKTRSASTVPAKASSCALKKGPPKPTSSSTKGRNSRAKPSNMEPTEVPTSLPEQDLYVQASPCGQLPSPSTNLLPSKKTRESRNLQPLRARDTLTCLPTTKPVAGEKRSHRSGTESPENSSCDSTEDGGAMHLKALKEEEETDHEVDPPKPDLSRKRRRTEDINSARGMSKTSTSTRNKRSETPAITTRSAKRLRSGVSSIRAPTAEPATRVFALWKQDGHYYSGVVHSRGLKNKYLVRFDDGTEDEVELKNMRHRQLLIGDRVIATQDNTKSVVSDVSHADSRGWFILEIDNGETLSTRQAGFNDIRVANRTIQSQWKERMLDPASIVTLVRPKPLLDTTPSKQSVLSTTPLKAQQELAKTGFVVTINPKNEEPIQTKDETMHAIKRHGGLVIEDWSSVFTMAGKHSQSNKRWIATPQDFCWKPEVNLDRVFLLSDDAHQKPKFLLALALGIPCLSFEWLTREGKLSSDWQPFLLPAGYSDVLGARISQLVDLDWGNCTEHLSDIMASRVPIKLFSQKTVLCIGADLVPLPPNRTKKNTSEEASRYVPWIILCMGATKVEAVADIKQVPLGYMQDFDYIVVKERDILGSVKLSDNVVVGDVNWVKECLVSSRLSLPESD